jgi:hypothetical protein
VRTVFRKNILTGRLDHHPRGSQPRKQEKTTNSRIRNELCNDKAGDYDASGASKREVDNEEIRQTGDLAELERKKFAITSGISIRARSRNRAVDVVKHGDHDPGAAPGVV